MSPTAKSLVRLGAGAGFSGDRLDPAVDLAERGALDYLVFECLAERTIALAVKSRRSEPANGFDPYLDERIRTVLPACVRNGVKIISNMGAANPTGAAARIAAIARELNFGGLRVAAVEGDNVLAAVLEEDPALFDAPGRVSALGGEILSANAYLGCEPIVEALAGGAQIVVTGRVADPSLFLAPLVHEFGWRLDDWPCLGRGTAIGHLLECAGQITGGYFADPGFKDVEDLARLGFPIAEVSRSGEAIITKLPDTGGQVTLGTCKEQLLYELHDPHRYLTPDVAADFSTIQFAQAGPDRVAVTGGGGRERPAKLKASVGYEDGYIGEGQITYAGPGAVERGRLALAIVSERLKSLGPDLLEQRLDLIGENSAAVTPCGGSAPEIRARVAIRARTPQTAARAGREVEALYTCGPAGGGGVTQCVRPVVAIASVLIDRERAPSSIVWEIA